MKKSLKCKAKSVGNTRLLAHAKMLLVLMNFFLWRVDYTSEGKLFFRANLIFAAYFILTGHDTHFCGYCCFWSA